VFIFMNMCVIVTVTIKEYWTLWHKIITVVMVILLEKVLKFCILLSGNNLLKQKTVHLYMTCYVYVL
jgi:hypothetical protein